MRGAGATALANALAALPDERGPDGVMRRGRQQSRLETLRLKNNPLGPEGVAALGRAAQTNKALRHLELRGCQASHAP